MLSASSMTAQRQEGNGPWAGSIFRPGIAVLAVLASVLGQAYWGCSAQAVTTEGVVVNRYSDLAIEGFDPVGYFVEARPMIGQADFEASQAGAGWRGRRGAGRDVRFRGGGEAGVDSGVPFRHPAEFDGRAERVSDRASSRRNEAFGAAVGVRTAHRGDPGLNSFGQAAGMDRFGERFCRYAQPLRAAADQSAPDKSERRCADDAY